MKVSIGSPTLRRYMTNYFSIGADARIGLGSEKHRGDSACCNKCCYCWEGFKKLFFTSTMTMNQVLLKVMKVTDTGEKNIVSVPIQENTDIGGNYFVGDPASIVFLNIGTYMGGRAHPWKEASDELGLISKTEELKAEFKPESHGDGLIEIFSFSSLLRLSLETMFSGNASRLAQDSGPFRIIFQESKNKDIVTYMNIDGEYYKLIKPKEISIKLAEAPFYPSIRIVHRNIAN